MKEVPFYPNREDDMSCALACYRMALKYFTGREYSWKELEELTGYETNIAAWTVRVWTKLAAEGFDIRMIEAFDYRRLQKEGDKYLRTYFAKPEEYQWQIKHTNVMEILPDLPAFLKTVHHEQRSPVLEDISQMLNDGYLVSVGLNSKVLDGKSGYAPHMVLCIDETPVEFIVHDPGLPPEPQRVVSKQLLWEAMGGDNTLTEVTGIKLVKS